MARSKHTDHAKVTAWTPTVKADFSGTRLACAIELFRSVDFEKMPEALEKMQAIYEARKWREELDRLNVTNKAAEALYNETMQTP